MDIAYSSHAIDVGIGAAVAQAFVRSGCSRIAITDINPDTLQYTKDAILRINPSASVLDEAGDIADEKFVDAFMDRVAAHFTRLDYAVNCAGILGGDTVKAVDMPTDFFDRLTAINYRGTWLSCRAQLRNMLKQEPLAEHLKQRGAVVNIASQLGVVARPGAGQSSLSRADSRDIRLLIKTRSRLLRFKICRYQHDPC